MRTMLILCAVALAALAPLCAAQAEGRVFLAVPDTVAIFEFNGVADEALPDGTAIPDLSGNALDAVVEHNDMQDLAIGAGDPAYGAANREGRRIGIDSRAAAIAVNDDGDAFEMNEAQSFSLEMYIHREDLGFAQKAPPSCPDAADANDDGKLDIADAIRVLGHLFAATGPLPPPFGACGTDPTSDTLGPCVFPGCP